jgi:hypothetical protein
MKLKTQRVEKITTTVNGRTFVSYRIIREEEIARLGIASYKDMVALVLRRLFKDQGELYEQIFGVSREDADLAGWHPDDSDFCDACDGWVKFLEAGGKIEKQVQTETMSVEEFVRSNVKVFFRSVLQCSTETLASDKKNEEKETEKVEP